MIVGPLAYWTWVTVKNFSWTTCAFVGFLTALSIWHFLSSGPQRKAHRLAWHASAALDAAGETATAVRKRTDEAYERFERLKEEHSGVFACFEHGEAPDADILRDLDPAFMEELSLLQDQASWISEHSRQADELFAIYNESITAAEAAWDNTLESRLARWTRSVASTYVTGTLTSLALLLAGRRREESRIQWTDQLSGAPENGIIVTPGMRLRYSAGFVLAALRYQISDIAALAWRPLEWVLSKNSRTNPALVSIVGAEIIYIQWNHGLDVLLTEGWAWCAGVAACAYGLARWLRQVRGIETVDGKQQEQ